MLWPCAVLAWLSWVLKANLQTTYEIEYPASNPVYIQYRRWIYALGCAPHPQTLTTRIFTSFGKDSNFQFPRFFPHQFRCCLRPGLQICRSKQDLTWERSHVPFQIGIIHLPGSQPIPLPQQLEIAALQVLPQIGQQVQEIQHEKFGSSPLCMQISSALIPTLKIY